MSKPKPRVVVADDHPAMLRAVGEIIGPHFDVVASVHDGQTAFQETARTIPDLVLSDIVMPGLDGLRLARKLNQQKLPSKVVFLTAQKDDDFISEALNVGATGYVLKTRLAADLVSAMHMAAAGKFFISPHAFAESPLYCETRHVLEFYLDENTFFEQMSEITYLALKRGEQVFIFLSKLGLHFARRRLSALGLDYGRAIERGHLYVFSVENILPSLMDGTRPQPSKFNAFFSPYWERAIGRAREHGSEVTIVSDLMATLLGQGYGHRIAASVEEVWNDLIPKHSCRVYCGCPVAHLCSAENREALSAICSEHGNVIAIDKWRADRSLVPITSNA